MKRIVTTLLALAALAVSIEARAASHQRPVLVELFTSQGCSSCPPAEAFLGELAQRDDVVALEMHVMYWDYIGWPDPFASAEITQRQREYGRALGRNRVYTPQMVINGEIDAVGSRKKAVNRAIDKARGTADLALAIDLALDPDRETVVVGVPGAHYEGEAVIWLMRYDAEHVTKVLRGENAGRTLRNVNVVRDVWKIGVWSGTPVEISLPASALTTGDGSDGCVVVVQEAGFGRVLATRRLMLAGDPS